AGLDVRVEVLATGPVDDMTITFRGDINAGMSLEIEANPDLYSRAEAQAHGERLAAFMTAAVGADTRTTVAPASTAEARHVIHACNATAHAVPATTLTALLETTMQRHPEAEALVFGDTHLTYAELDRRSAALAAALHERGIGSESVVGIALRRSV